MGNICSSFNNKSKKVFLRHQQIYFINKKYFCSQASIPRTLDQLADTVTLDTGDSTGGAVESAAAKSVWVQV